MPKNVLKYQAGEDQAISNWVKSKTLRNSKGFSENEGLI